MLPEASRKFATEKLSQIARDEREECDCSICFDFMEKPAVTPCGHLFCMGCLNQMIETPNSNCTVGFAVCIASWRNGFGIGCGCSSWTVAVQCLMFSDHIGVKLHGSHLEHVP
jgi:hypothetical protein